jgi:nucleoporin POM152
MYHGERPDQRSSKIIEVRAGTPQTTIRMETSRSGIYRYTLKQLSDAFYVDPSQPSDILVLEQAVNGRPGAKFKNPGKIHKYCLETGTGDDAIPIVLEGVAPFTLTISVRSFSTGKEESISIPNIDTKHYTFRVPARVLSLGGHAVSILKVRDARGCTRKSGLDVSKVHVAVADLPSLTSLDSKPYYCVGDRISYSLAGAPPFILEYSFNGRTEKVSTTNQFQRLAERPGTLSLLSIRDSASECKVSLNITKEVHSIPTVRVSEGSQVVEGIHEGDYVDIHFQLSGTPPFTFTYVLVPIL